MEEKQMNEQMLETFLNRRSIRSFTGEPVPMEKLNQIIMAGLSSASSRAARPWELIVVRNKETLQALSGCRTTPVKMLQDGACAIAVVADASKLDVWVEDCSIVMANMHLMADSLGLGSCWVQCRLREAVDGRSTEEYVRDILHFPETHRLEAILALGVIVTHAAPYTPDQIRRDKVHYETF